MPEPGGGALRPQFLADQLTLFQPGGQTLPTLYYWRPQIFSPPGIPEQWAISQGYYERFNLNFQSCAN